MKFLKYLPAIVGVLLGLVFVSASLTVLLNLAPEQPPPPEGSAAAHFMAAFAPTGYLTFVKVFELLGGLLVAIPRTRNFGLLVLGPIVLNILAVHAFVMKGEGLVSPPIVMIVVFALYLLYDARRKFASLAG